MRWTAWMAGAGGWLLSAGTALGQFGGAPARPPEPKPAEPVRPADPPAAVEAGDFARIVREGSVDVASAFDVSGLTIPAEEIHAMIAQDQIPALVSPGTEAVGASDWLVAEDLVIAAVVGDEAVAVPLRMIVRHEAVNLVVGGEPVAVTYSPLSHSATVFSRRVEIEPDEHGRRRFETLEFGVSGALYNSNVLYYERTHRSLWGQIAFGPVSGPVVGTRIRHFPVRVVPWGHFRAAHPGGRVLSREAGGEEGYDTQAYAGYLEREDLYVPVRAHGSALPTKTQGLGLRVGGETAFVPVAILSDEPGGSIIPTALGAVRARRVGAGVSVVDAPALVQTATCLYFAWSAYYPQTRVLTSGDLRDGSAE